MKPAIFERSADTEAVISVLRKVNGDVGYEALAKRACLSVGRTKQVLASARNALRKEKILFEAIRGYGLRRLGDLEKARKTPKALKRIRRTAQREIKDLKTIENFGSMPNIDQVMVTTNRTVLNAIVSQSRVKAEPANINAPLIPDVARMTMNR